MSTSRGWRQQLDDTWLGDERARTRLDAHVRRHLARHRGLGAADLTSVVALTVDAAYGCLLDLGLRGLWLPCTTFVALTGELVLCAPLGSVLGDEAIGRWPRESRASMQALRLVRNAACHPAHQADAGSGEPPIRRLVRHIENSDPDAGELGARLQAAWSFLGERQVAEYALRKLDAAGRAVCDRAGIRVR